MSGDDDLRETIAIDPGELERERIEFEALDFEFQRDDLVQTLEMDSSEVELHRTTQPERTVLEATTQRHEIPSELLEEARRTDPDVARARVIRDERGRRWLEFETIPDSEGRVRLPAPALPPTQDRPIRVRVEFAED